MKTISLTQIIATAILVASPVTLRAEAPPAAVLPPAWQSSAFLGFSLTRGNSDTLLVTGNIKTTKKDERNEWAFGADFAYGETESAVNGETEVNNEMAHGFGQYNRLFSERFFGYLRADALHDGISDVNYRVTLSPGVGYYFIKNKQTSLATEVGPGVVFEERGGEQRTYATLRLAERFEHKFSDRARVWQSAELLPEVSDFDNYLFNFEAGIAASISKNLELSIVVQDNYVNQPAPGREKNDLKIISGATYKF